MMDISPRLDEQSDEPLYMQLYGYFKTDIQSGKIRSLTKLPSIRRLAEDLAISKTTVQMAYQQLTAEGYIESRERSGYYVAAFAEDTFGQLLSGPIFIPPAGENKPTDILYDFYVNAIDSDHFPIESWRRCTNQALNGDRRILGYGDRQGEWELRHALSGYLRQARGVHCRPEQMVMGAGTQTIMEMLCRLIQWDGKPAAMEEPGYAGVRRVFEQMQIEIRPIPLETDGIDIDALSRSRAKAVYVTPSHQYPLGMVMPVAKRLKLLQWANENDGWIIEDDYDGEFRYRGRPIPSLQGLDEHERVIYIGTFSKSLMPAVRISYMVLPAALLSIYRSRFFHRWGQTSSALHQQSLKCFIENGEWERHIRKMRTLYRKKQTLLMESIEQSMGDHVAVDGEQAGLHLVLKVKSDRSGDELVRMAEAAKVKVYSTAENWLRPPAQCPPFILLGFGGLSFNDIEQGIPLLHRAWLPGYA